MKYIDKLVKKLVSESLNEKADEIANKIHSKMGKEMKEDWGDMDDDYEEDDVTSHKKFLAMLKKARRKKGYEDDEKLSDVELEEEEGMTDVMSGEFDYVQEKECMEGDCGEMEESMARGEGDEYMADYRRKVLRQLYNLYPGDEHLKSELGIEDEDGEMEEELHGNQKKIDVAPPKGKITKDDFEKLRSMKKKTDEEVEEGNAFTEKLKQTKKGEKFKLGNKTYTDTSDLEESYSYSISFGKDTLKLTEEELISMIEELVVEQKAKAKGTVEYDRVHKKDEDINKKANKESFKKMKDYVKAGSKGSFEENVKHFPKGNGELAKMDKKAYVPSEAVDEYVADFAYPGMTNLTFDEIKPDDERIKKYLEGDSTTGNSSEYANAVETEVGKKFFKNYKDNAYGAEQKEASYKRQTQPVDVAGENKGAKSYKKTKGQKALDKLSENVETQEKKNILSEEMVRMKEMIGYNKKSQ